jgi:hypothetical protein
MRPALFGCPGRKDAEALQAAVLALFSRALEENRDAVIPMAPIAWDPDRYG